ncbi:MAG: FAD-binding oxidoreductase [Acidobacteria bacterium]|nr:FAD-binding oxidoreductase [Acidobacteriota bacterium]
MSWTAELVREIRGQVLVDDASRASVSTDFGRIIVRKPAAVVRPASAEDVASAIKFAVCHGLSVSTRGGGHSQTGQSLSDQIVLDMTSLDKVTEVNPGQGTLTCQTGLKWRTLVEQLSSQQLSPFVLTNNLDVTIGGTLSTGGLGVASWRYGTQADNCAELEVVTGEGEIVRCSREQNQDLFDAVRAGMGQVGVITGAKLRIRRYLPGFRSFYLLYDDLGVLLDDLKIVMTDERFDYLESWCVPCPQGFKQVGGTRQAFAQWFYPLHATVETEGSSGVADDEKLRGLKFYKHVHTENGSLIDFFARLDALFAIWRRAGFWEYAHPWMECVLPWPSTAPYIGQVLQNMPPQAVAGGHILLWPARGNSSSVPLFMRPTSDFLMGFGILPAVPPRFLEEALPKLNMVSQTCMMMGGKRYLSGWIAFDAAQWKAHYGEKWPAVVRLKKHFDPYRVLNPGFIKYE